MFWKSQLPPMFFSVPARKVSLTIVLKAGSSKPPVGN